MAFGMALERGNGFTIYDSAANQQFKNRQNLIDRAASRKTSSLTASAGSSLGGRIGGGGIGSYGDPAEAAAAMRERLAQSDFGRQQQAFSEKTNASSRLQAEGAAQRSQLQAQGADQRSRIQKEGMDQREAAKGGDRSAAMRAIAEMIAKRRAGGMR